jgi:integrase
VKAVMDAASIEGTYTSPKGLRHAFGVVHALNKTPLPTLQRWMGHSDPKTTASYMQAVGEEARQLAGAAW